jgi:hypothetical protein
LVEGIEVIVGRVEGLIVAFMGWVTALVGLLIAVQERVIRLDIGYRVENPYYELGIAFFAAGMGLVVFGVMLRYYNIVKQK